MPDSTLAEHLKAAERIDEAIRVAATEDALTVPGVKVEGLFSISAPGQARLVEDLWLARRTYSTVHFLMLNTANAKTAAGDFTEDAGVLTRRLLELLAQVSWLTDIEPPDDIQLPAEIGAREDLEDEADAIPWPKEDDRTVMVAYLSSAREWIDIQSLRADRTEIAQQIKTAKALAGTASDDATTKRQAEGLAVLNGRDEMTVARLEKVGAPTSKRQDTTSLLTRIGPQYGFAYRYESDASHGMAMGRLHQRGKSGEPMIGAPSEPWRRHMIQEVANAIMLEIAQRSLTVLGADIEKLDELAKEHIDRLAESTNQEEA